MGCSESKDDQSIAGGGKRDSRRTSADEQLQLDSLPSDPQNQQQSLTNTEDEVDGSVTSSRIGNTWGNSATVQRGPVAGRLNPLLPRHLMMGRGGDHQAVHQLGVQVIVANPSPGDTQRSGGGVSTPSSGLDEAPGVVGGGASPTGRGGGGTMFSSPSNNSNQQKQQQGGGGVGGGVRQLVGNFTVLSTMVSRANQDHQDIVERNYKGSLFHPENDIYIPSVQERYSLRIEEVKAGNAVGHGQLWMDSSKQFEPVLIEMLEAMSYTLRTPIARTSLVNAITGLREDLRKIEMLLDHPADFDAALGLSENLYIRARGNHLPKLTAVFLELFTRVNDMLVLEKNRDEFMGALQRQDVNQYKDTFFATDGGGNEDMAVALELLDQYLESELGEVISYCVCVAWTAIDELQTIANEDA